MACRAGEPGGAGGGRKHGPRVIRRRFPVNGELAVIWLYQDRQLLTHLSVVATGPGGRAEKVPFNVVHP